MNFKSIAILPFTNLSSDEENEYFSDGICEELINALTSIQGLKVTARTSSFAFKGRQMDVRHIGNELGVSTLLEGSVRKSNHRVRITAQLVRADDGFQIWSGKYDRELVDIFDLQDDISRTIAEQIRENFGHFEIEERLIEAPTTNIEAYNLYLKARFNHLKWDGPGIEAAIEYYQKSIELDPLFSWPHFGIGYCFAMSGSWGSAPDLLEIAEQNISRGFELDKDSFLGYYSKATLEFWGRWNFKEAYQLYRKAIELNPAYTEAEEGLVELLTAVGEFDIALAHSRNMLKIDPLSKNHFFTIAHIFYLQGNYDKAEHYFNESLKLDAGFTHSIARQLTCFIMQNNRIAFDEFIADKTIFVSTETYKLLFNLANGHHDNADKKRLETIIEEVSKEVTILPWGILLTSQSGDVDRAIDLVTRAVEAKSGQILNFAHMPLLRPLCEDQRFKNLIERVHSKKIPIQLPDKKRLTQVVSRSLLSNQEIEETTEKLEQLMDEDCVYQDSSLSLTKLSEYVGLHPNKLSWMLNEVFSMSFNDYINSFRVACFKEKALKEDAKNYTLLGLAFESGFNSKSTFNDYFKKKTGLTPRAWLKQQ